MVVVLLREKEAQAQNTLIYVNKYPVHKRYLPPNVRIL